MIMFRGVFGRYEANEFNQLEAAELLGISERTFRRWCQRFEDGGEAGLLDRRLGRASGKRVPVDREDEVERLYRMRYNGFTARHFHEHLVRDHGFRWGYTWTKVFPATSKGLLERAPRRRRTPAQTTAAGRCPGMMLHQDGSRHAWLSGQEALDLIVTMDDATSAIYSAFLTPEEGHRLDLPGVGGGFGVHGLPLSLYTDRGSHYFHDPRGRRGGGSRAAHPGWAGVGASGRRAHRGVFARGARPIGADVPDLARSAGEGTGAGLDHHGRSGEHVHPRCLCRASQCPASRCAREQDGSAFVAIPEVDLNEVLCIQEDRQVGNDNTVTFHRHRLQIPPSPLRPHFVKARVRVRQYHDGTHAIFLGPRCLGRYDAAGELTVALSLAA